MFQLDVLIDTSVLPPNVMSLRDDKFIDFVKEEAGRAAATLLEVQDINCAKSLLMTDNVFSIMDLQSNSLNDFKHKYGYMQDDGTFVIQPGIKGNVQYLIDLLKKKCIDDAKLAKLSKRNQLLSSLDKTIDTSSTITKATSPVPSNSSSEIITSKSSNLSINGHKTYLIDTLNSWCEKNKSKFDLSQLSLVEGQHYFISIFDDLSGALKGNIKCCCKKSLSLTLFRGKFQLSNFYRHLQDFRNGNTCNTIKEIIKIHQLTSSTTADNQQSFAIPNTVLYQGSSSLNFVPSASVSVTIPSNSTFSTSSSISISTDDHESIEKSSSSSLKTKRKVKRKFNSIESSYNTRKEAKRMRRE
ncbi:unnamed protein product [Rotaria sp. Silwood2]|nr:unnamed protein product [Rotaria sp. Silwood2]CAF4135453.1 unnamed protein product [Rotaria sp. Silwood2]CAF4318187.1 unnamed protein product [Rotaria sp. Silwood2]